MENRKDIGKAFREKLNGVHKAPGDHVWQAIKDDLPKKKRRRALFWWMISAPAIILLLGLLGYPIWNNNGTGNNPKVNSIENGTGVSNSNDNTSGLPSHVGKHNDHGDTVNTHTEADGMLLIGTKGNTSNAKIDNTGDINNNSSSAAGKNSRNTGSLTNANNAFSKSNPGAQRDSQRKSNKNTTFSNSKQNDRTASSDKKRYNSDNSGIPEKSELNVQATDANGNNIAEITGVITDSIQTAIETAIAANKPAEKAKPAAKDEKAKKQTDTVQRPVRETVWVEKKKKQEKEPDNNKRMFVYGFVAPGLYTAGDADYIDASVSNSDVTAETSFGYGLYLGYNLNQKWSIRAGFINTKLELQTEGLYLSGSPDDYSGIKYAANMSNNSLVQRLTQGLDGSNQPYAGFSINHNLQFTEIPVEATYTFYGTKFRLGVIGGVTARFVTKNEMFAENNTGRVYIGEAAEDKFKLGLGLGAGLQYKFTPSVQANLEPMARYYFDSPGYVQPFVFTVQAGIQYNFNLLKKKK